MAVAGLVGLGYAVGGPVMEYLQGERSGDPDDTLEWKPPVTSPPAESAETEEISAPLSEEEPEPDEPAPLDGKSVYASGAVLTNTATVAAFVSQAKADGYSSVIFDLKDSSGYVWYSTMIEGITGSDVVKSTVSAAQIVQITKGAGLTPIARINTLKDHQAPSKLEAVSYRFADDSYGWMDARPENGGRQWANPYLTGTQEYIAEIVAEATGAGFAQVMLANTIFPDFTDYDKTILSATVTGGSRYNSLVSLVNKAGDGIYLELQLKDALENWGGYSGTAEILRGAKNLTGTTGLVLVFNKSEIGTELKTGETTSTALPTDMGSLVSLLYKQAERALGGSFTIIPCIDKTGMSDTELAQAVAALGACAIKN